MMVTLTRTVNSKVAPFYFGGTCEKNTHKTTSSCVAPPMVQAWTVCPICTSPPTFWVCENISWCSLTFLSHRRRHVLLESGTWCPENCICFEKCAQRLHIHLKKKWVVLVYKSKSWAIIPLLTSALYLRQESLVFEVVYNESFLSLSWLSY